MEKMWTWGFDSKFNEFCVILTIIIIIIENFVSDNPSSFGVDGEQVVGGY